MVFPLLVILVVLLTLSALFSLAETALVSLSAPKAKALASQNPSAAKDLSRWIEKPYEILTLIITGNTLVNVSFATVATILAFHFIPSWPANRVELVSWIVETAILFMMGEMLPKLVARRYPEPISLALLPWLSRLRRVARPFSHPVNLFLRPFHKEAKNASLILSLEELKAFLEEGEGNGSDQDRQSVTMMQRALTLHHRTAETIMTPIDRVDIVELDPSNKPVRSRDLVLDLLVEEGHTRTPIKKGGRLIGFVHIKDLLPLISRDTGGDISPFLRAALDVKSDSKVADLLPLFQERGVHIAFVYNPKGQIVGIVTLEDVMEEITGEILDEFDVPSAGERN